MKTIDNIVIKEGNYKFKYNELRDAYWGVQKEV